MLLKQHFVLRPAASIAGFRLFSQKLQCSVAKKLFSCSDGYLHCSFQTFPLKTSQKMKKL